MTKSGRICKIYKHLAKIELLFNGPYNMRSEIYSLILLAQYNLCESVDHPISNKDVQTYEIGNTKLTNFLNDSRALSAVLKRSPSHVLFALIFHHNS
jgi:hypothetical protein